MRRIIVTRWWALAFALLLGVAGVIGTPSVGRTEGGGAQVGDGTGGGGVTDPTASGDPDVPINTGKTSFKGAYRYGRSGTLGVSQRSAGDAPATQVVWAYKYRLALQLFRAYVLRF